MNDIHALAGPLREDFIAMRLVWSAFVRESGRTEGVGYRPPTFDADVMTILTLDGEDGHDNALELYNVVIAMWSWHPDRDSLEQWTEVIRAFEVGRFARGLAPITQTIERGRLEHTPGYYIARAVVRAMFWFGVVFLILGAVWAVWIFLKAAALILTGQL